MAWGPFNAGSGGAQSGGGTAKEIAYEDTLGISASNIQEALDKVLGNTLPKLTVTTTAGSALTITDGQSTITGTATGGSFTTTLPRLGEWTVTASLAGLTTDDTVTVDVVGGQYTLNLPYFAATLAVTAATGSTVTATMTGTGKAYKAAADSDGVASVRIKRAGTYTVQAVRGDAISDTAEIEVTQNGGSYTTTVHFCVLTLTAPVGSEVTASCGDTTLTAIVSGNDENGTVVFYPPELGTWSITATLGTDSTNATVAATEYKNYALTLTYINAVLEKNEWKVIRKVSDEGKAKNWWSVGDTKSVTINGKVGATTISSLKVDAFIIGFNHNSGKEGSNRIHFLLGKISGKFVGLVDSSYGSTTSTSGAFTMNTSNTNSGGWGSSQMRSKVLGSASSPTSPTANTLLAALPSDLRAAMKSCTKYTDNSGGGNTASNVSSTTDYLFLLSEYEVFATHQYCNDAEQNYQAQYDYFKAGNSKVANKHSATGTAAVWWLRSPYYNIYINTGTSFCAVSSSGSLDCSYAHYAYGVVPGFVV
jgi:hypothetical protein